MANDRHKGRQRQRSVEWEKVTLINIHYIALQACSRLQSVIPGLLSNGNQNPVDAIKWHERTEEKSTLTAPSLCLSRREKISQRCRNTNVLVTRTTHALVFMDVKWTLIGRNVRMWFAIPILRSALLANWTCHHTIIITHQHQHRHEYLIGIRFFVAPEIRTSRLPDDE